MKIFVYQFNVKISPLQIITIHYEICQYEKERFP